MHLNLQQKKSKKHFVDNVIFIIFIMNLSLTSSFSETY